MTVTRFVAIGAAIATAFAASACGSVTSHGGTPAKPATQTGPVEMVQTL